MARIDRLVLGIFGRINAGKSTLMNLLTQQETSIVDPTPGTTTDIRSAVMEIHSLGPVRILDTAGLDEGRLLGEKKRRKTMNALEETDVAILVVDPVQAWESGEFTVEERVIRGAMKAGRVPLMVYNRKSDIDSKGPTLQEAILICRREIPGAGSLPFVDLDLSDAASLEPLIQFISTNRPTGPRDVPLLPFVSSHGAVLLHIPLDEESPEGRLLRPQEMAMEYLLRVGVPIGLHRVILSLARSANPDVADTERQRFSSFLDSLENTGEGVQLVLTDSQAIDIMARWVPEHIPLTTFSVMMIHQTSEGRLPLFVRGVRALEGLRSGDRVLVAEACNHDRIAEDIGTVQIPRGLGERIPGLIIDHSFGRVFPDRLELRRSYSLVIHCGGCMISKQKMGSRLARLAESGVPVTNYGLVLAWLEGPAILERILKPWA
jgi:[FeFe] hydrogenase H-cluster maturation GTPase HydF